MVFGIFKFDIPAVFRFARLTQCRGCSQQTHRQLRSFPSRSPHHRGDRRHTGRGWQSSRARGEHKETPRGAKSLIAAGMGAEFLRSTQPGAGQGLASPGLSLSHVWKKPPQKLQWQPAGMWAEYVSPLAGNRWGAEFPPLFSYPDQKGRFLELVGEA